MENKLPNEKPGPRPSFSRWFKKRSPVGKFIWTFFFLFVVWMFIGERSEYAILFLKIRIYSPVIMFCIVCLYLIFYIFKKSHVKGKIILGIVLGGIVVTDYMFVGVTPWGLYDYVSSYRRYESIEKISISELPETDHEVIQPRISIKTAAEQQIQGTDIVSKPFLVRDSATYLWTLALEPNTFLRRYFTDDINTVYNIPAEKSSTDFSGNNQSAVSFIVGENLGLGRQMHTATERKLSLLDLFSVEPSEPRFMRDDNNEWVEVIPLVRWKGFFFPQPEFGGVNVIKQQHLEGLWEDVVEMARRFLFGTGKIYTPDEMKKFRYLQNQNLMPLAVTKSIANSFRFRNGFSSPWAWNHNGDTRVPIVDSIEKGIDEQPITSFFKMSQVAHANDMLYEYIGLEPFDEKKDGLVTSIFIPSDGGMQVYVYNHDERKDGVLGATAVPVKIRENKQSYDWNSNRVTSIRPWIHKINKVTCSFWLASVVTNTKHLNGWYQGRKSPVALVDLKSQQVIWVDSENPDTWITKIKEETGMP